MSKINNKYILELFLVVLINLIYYFTHIKDLMVKIYLEFLVKLFSYLFPIQTFGYSIVNPNKDYSLLLTYSCTTIPLYLFLFSLLFILKPFLSVKISLNKIVQFVLIVELVNLLRFFLILMLYYYSDANLEELYLIHGILMFFISFFLVYLFIKIFNIKINEKISIRH